MRIGLISDIHGNLPALEAVLARLEHDEIDRYVCLGDVAVGPWASETVKRLRSLDPDSILGNWDAWMLNGDPPCGNSPTGKMLLEMASFWAGRLDGEDLDYMRRAKTEIRFDIGPSRLSFFHGSPRSYNEPILAATPTEELAHMFDARVGPLAIVGHTHVQMARRLPFTTIVNPGSVGLSFLEWPVTSARVCPWADYAVIDYHREDELSLEFRRVPYDAAAVIEYTLASGVPHAEWWTACWELESGPVSTVAPGSP
jgi:predicted phosphodiesterase